MKQYLDLLDRIIKTGAIKPSSRPNLPPTLCLTSAHIDVDLREGLPLVTTKAVFVKGVIHELLWFLRGETNIKTLVDHKVNIWNKDAYRWYQKQAKDRGFDNEFNSLEAFAEAVKLSEYDALHNPGHWDSMYKLGDLGKVYGYQWRNRNGIDQVAEVINSLQNDPYSRYHIIDAWNPKDRPEMALPPCHLTYIFAVVPLNFEELWDLVEPVYGQSELSSNCRDFNHLQEIATRLGLPINRLDLTMLQRSVDTACGLPFNLASMAMLQTIMAKVSNMVPGHCNWTGVDTHLYVPHVATAKEQIARKPIKLPKLEIAKELRTLEDVLALEPKDFVITDYVHHDKLDYELFAG